MCWFKWFLGVKVCKVFVVVILYCLLRFLVSDVNVVLVVVCLFLFFSVVVMVFVWFVVDFDLMLLVDLGFEKVKSSFEGLIKFFYVVWGMEWFVCLLDLVL